MSLILSQVVLKFISNSISSLSQIFISRIDRTVLFKKKLEIFEHNVDFAHERLIKIFRTLIYLRIASDSEFEFNISSLALIFKLFIYIFVVVVDTKSNISILIVFNIIKKISKKYLNCDFDFNNQAIYLKFLRFVVQLINKIINLVIFIEKKFYKIIINKIDEISIKLNIVFVKLNFIFLSFAKNTKIR